MQQVKIYNDLLHLTGEWMNADSDMLKKRDGRPPLTLSLSFFFRGWRTSPPPPTGSATEYHGENMNPGRFAPESKSIRPT